VANECLVFEGSVFVWQEEGGGGGGGGREGLVRHKASMATAVTGGRGRGEAGGLFLPVASVMRAVTVANSILPAQVTNGSRHGLSCLGLEGGLRDKRRMHMAVGLLPVYLTCC
jgi:hypothetical protein